MIFFWDPNEKKIAVFDPEKYTKRGINCFWTGSVVSELNPWLLFCGFSVCTGYGHMLFVIVQVEDTKIIFLHLYNDIIIYGVMSSVHWKTSHFKQPI